MLKLRLLTAIILVVLFVSAVLFLQGTGFILFVGLIAGMACWEWSDLARLQALPLRALYTSAVLVTGVSLFVYADIAHSNLLLYIGSLFWLSVIVALIGDPVSAGGRMQPVAYTLLSTLIGLLLISSLWVSFVRLHAMPDGEYHLLGLCLLVWSADTGAFFVGRTLGRHKLAPRISPNKTIEGAVGGVGAAMLAALLWFYLVPLPGMPLSSFILLAALTVVAAIYGDLLESVFKRIRGVKDSGKLLPGHGGILDRIDSLTAAAPVFVAGLLLLGTQA